tara:strand:+ start:51 stop:254 length:204 start_codon:yes stop_codon:yes gene_type:complete
MPTSTSDKNIAKLVDTVQNLQSEVKTLKNRINTLVDELHVTKSSITTFKKNVAEDVTYLTERIDGGR